MNAPTSRPLDDQSLTSMRHTTGNVVLLSCSTALGSALGALATVHVARAVSAAQWGITATAVSWATLLSGVLLFGSNTQMVRDLASGSANAAEFTILWRQIQLIAVSAASLAFITLLALQVRPSLSILIAIVGGALVVRQAGTTPFIARSAFPQVALSVLVERVLLVGVAVGMVAFTRPNETTYLVAQAAALAAGSLYMQSRLAPEFRSRTRVHYRGIPRRWLGFAPFGVVAVTFAIAQLDVSLVAAIAGREEAGYFGLAARIVGPLSFVGSAAASVLLPAAARPAQAHPARRLRHRHLVALPIVVVVLVAAVVVIPPNLVSLLGIQYRPAYGAIHTYCIATVLVTMNQPLAALLQARGHERYVSQVLAGSVGVHLGGAAIGAAVAGASGAAAGYTACNAVILVSFAARLLAKGAAT
jgi:O-antigen/teichoic acid export membrane protein